MTDLTEGIAVVTGAGGGLGRALAVELSQHMTVVGLGRDATALEGTAQLSSEGRFHGIEADVSCFNSTSQAFEKTRIHGAITLLINNAAQYPRRDFTEETAESFMEVVATNLGGTVACTRAALNDMLDTGFGRIMNVATFADIAPLPASSAYSVSKGAARIFTRALIADIGDRFPGIVVNDWMPGMLATKMGIPDGLEPEQAAKWGAQLALWHDPSLTGTTWEMDREIPPPRSLKRRIADRVLMKPRVAARRLG
ncbi:SDR family NAD(P)-dependent oxidoreductase [Nioella sediminis]|jgi:NAD(P)-dependent dehydrogenase (short-subunit alcohol dehydrogenase family)|uniref:SDR family NAD(P)-dependent oxidoreductase n=1 Tax=Nioella sediminis TaxID=1912092 RepID=UPI0008FD16A1|nr:SDR family oxidoreductase [Nioella sediminis]TBX27948.1 oxidoreductase [Roseovarius sp. JS7-11]